MKARAGTPVPEFDGRAARGLPSSPNIHGRKAHSASAAGRRGTDGAGAGAFSGSLDCHANHWSMPDDCGLRPADGCPFPARRFVHRYRASQAAGHTRTLFQNPQIPFTSSARGWLPASCFCSNDQCGCWFLPLSSQCRFGVPARKPRRWKLSLENSTGPIAQPPGSDP